MAANHLRIKTPPGAVLNTKNLTAKLDWDVSFGPDRTQHFVETQKFIDASVLRLDAPYVPFQTGMLVQSGILGTVVGSGEVNYIAPYAAAQYYGTADSRGYDARRGGHWFERMKVDHKDAILRGAAAIAGGKAK